MFRPPGARLVATDLSKAMLDAIAGRFGAGPVDGKIQAHVIATRA